MSGAARLDAAGSDAAGLMDRVYAKQRYIYDITRKYYLLGRDDLIRNLALPPGGRVLEIGCGTARNLVAIARRYPQAECYGLDISAAMLETATRAVTRAGLATRIHMAQGDATSFDPQALFGVAAFDRVVISYALSMIPPWREVLQHATTLLAPGGSIHIVDFGDQAGLPAAFKTMLEAWLARFHVAPRATLPEEVEKIAISCGFRSSSSPRFRGYAVRAEVVRARG